jgi:phenylalanyl-tRNA synthetase alpha subunit
MMETPIDIPENPFSVGSFDLEDVPELIEQPKQVVRETTQRKTSNIDADTIRKIVREEIEDVVRDVVSEYLDKSLVTEDIQIKVGETIFSGNLKPLPKRRKK